MTFEGMNVVRGEYIYSFAETIAISLIPTKAALVGVANIKYDALVGGVLVIFKFTIVRNNNGYGIYKFIII